MKMETYSSLRDLLAHSREGAEMYSKLSPDAQIALQNQGESIHTTADLARISTLFRYAK